VRLAQAPLEALCLDAWWRGERGGILVRFGGMSAAAQATTTGTLLSGLSDVSLVEDDETLWTAHRARQRHRDGTVLKVSGRITDLPAVVAAARALGGEVISRAALGISYVVLPPADDMTDDARVAAIRQALAPRACTVLDGSTRIAEPWPTEQPGVLAVQTRIKARFDPARIFRPGTFLGGI
jgi:glycolate oxidase FAD binding subunit